MKKRITIFSVLLKGIKSLKSGRTYTADEVDAQLSKEFGI